VYLSAGTYTVGSSITVPANVTLRGAGANQTILNSTVTSGPVVIVGGTAGVSYNPVSITGGTAAGSTAITVSSASGITVGTYLAIAQQNDGKIVSVAGAEGTCTWCDGWTSTGLYSQGQIVEVESVSGTTIGISPALYVSYTLSPIAVPFTASAKYAGVENLQVYANNTHTGGDYSNFYMSKCAYCWISGVEGNYTDGDHVEVAWGYHDQIQNSYFSNAYIHAPGTYDSTVDLELKTSGTLIQNNILERLHISIMMEWGPAGNVSAYNYMFGNFDATSTDFMESSSNFHGAHPQFNLFEGNIEIFYSFDNIWGSSANNTLFRNFVVSAEKNCAPATGRGTVTCSPMGAWGGSGVKAWWNFYNMNGLTASALSTNYNSVGNIYGSTTFMSVSANGTLGNGDTYNRMVVAICGPIPCGTNSWNDYSNIGFNYSLGYNEGSTGGGSSDSLYPYNTLFIHGDYASATNAVTWASGVTHTLPASFYLSSAPSWWGSVPWPAIGPDVVSGIRSDSYGYANKIPAQVCYESMGGTDGTGSPLTTFNAATCYSAAMPATNLVATPH
jgi:hypothetical protein